MCGGSIGSSKYVISAAHCKSDPSRIIIAYGWVIDMSHRFEWFFKNKYLEEQWQPCCYQAIQCSSAIQRSSYWLWLCFHWNGDLQTVTYSQSYTHDLQHILFCKSITADSNWLHLTFRLKNLSSLNTFNQSLLFQLIQIQKIMFQSMVILAQHPAGDIHNMTHLEIPSLSQVHFFKKMIFRLNNSVYIQ